MEQRNVEVYYFPKQKKVHKLDSKRIWGLIWAFIWAGLLVLNFFMLYYFNTFVFFLPFTGYSFYLIYKSLKIFFGKE